MTIPDRHVQRRGVGGRRMKLLHKRVEFTFEATHDIGFVITLVQLFQRFKGAVDHRHIVNYLWLSLDE